MYSLVLSVHIIGAAATLLAVLVVLSALTRGRSEIYRKLSRILGSLAAFEVGTGVALAALSPATMLSLCDNIALYVLLVAVVLAALARAMRKQSLLFPYRTVIAPLSGSLVLVMIALFAGV